MRILESKAVRPGCLLAILAAMLGQLAPTERALAQQPIVAPRALAHATMALEANTGGKVLEIRLADEKGEPAFEAALSKDDSVVYMRIKSVSDDVTEIAVSELPPWLAKVHLEDYMRGVAAAKVPLADAIVKAEELAAAPAIGAGIAKPLSGTHPVLAYYVEMMKGDQRIVSAIDAQSGAFIAHPESLYKPYTPVKLMRRLAEAAGRTWPFAWRAVLMAVNAA